MDTDLDRISTEWSKTEELCLLRTLARLKARGRWLAGDNNPERSAWTTCEIALAGSELRSGGTQKTAVAIEAHWYRVGGLFSQIYAPHFIVLSSLKDTSRS